MCDPVIQYSNKFERGNFCSSSIEVLYNEQIFHLQYNKESLKLKTKGRTHTCTMHMPETPKNHLNT